MHLLDDQHKNIKTFHFLHFLNFNSCFYVLGLKSKNIQAILSLVGLVVHGSFVLNQLLKN